MSADEQLTMDDIRRAMADAWRMREWLAEQKAVAADWRREYCDERGNVKAVSCRRTMPGTRMVKR